MIISSTSVATGTGGSIRWVSSNTAIAATAWVSSEAATARRMPIPERAAVSSATSRLDAIPATLLCLSVTPDSLSTGVGI